MAGSIIGAIMGADAADDAADKQAMAASDASNRQQRQYDLTREDLLKQKEETRADYSPFLQAGTSATNQLGYVMGLGGEGTGEAGSLAKPFTMGDFEQDEGYNFILKKGEDAVKRALSARGKYYSGGAVKSLTDYNQGMAKQEYQSAYDRFNQNQNNLYSRLAGLSNTGMGAASGIASSGMNTQGQLNSAGQNAVNNITSNIMDAGNAQAAGQIGSANAWVTGLGNASDNAFKGAGMYNNWGKTPAYVNNNYGWGF